MTDLTEAVAVCFAVNIDDKALGAFISCEGLGFEVVVEQREEGGINGWVWQLPTRIKYSNVKLTRPVTKDSATIAKWFADQASGVKRRTAIIEARTQENLVVARWGLIGVVPVRWTGPQLSAENNKVATETLELAHHGFLGSSTGG